jgi:hypothetical protein
LEATIKEIQITIFREIVGGIWEFVIIFLCWFSFIDCGIIYNLRIIASTNVTGWIISLVQSKFWLALSYSNMENVSHMLIIQYPLEIYVLYFLRKMLILIKSKEHIYNCKNKFSLLFTSTTLELLKRTVRPVSGFGLHRTGLKKPG